MPVGRSTAATATSGSRLTSAWGGSAVAVFFAVRLGRQPSGGCGSRRGERVLASGRVERASDLRCLAVVHKVAAVVETAGLFAFRAAAVRQRRAYPRSGLFVRARPAVSPGSRAAQPRVGVHDLWPLPAPSLPGRILPAVACACCGIEAVGARNVSIVLICMISGAITVSYTASVGRGEILSKIPPHGAESRRWQVRMRRRLLAEYWLREMLYRFWRGQLRGSCAERSWAPGLGRQAATGAVDTLPPCQIRALPSVLVARWI